MFYDVITVCFTKIYPKKNTFFVKKSTAKLNLCTMFSKNSTNKRKNLNRDNNFS